MRDFWTSNLKGYFNSNFFNRDRRITSKNWIFRIIEIRIIGSLIAIDNREKSRDCPLTSNNPVVSDNRRSDNRDLTVFSIYNIEKPHRRKYFVYYWKIKRDLPVRWSSISILWEPIHWESWEWTCDLSRDQSSDFRDVKNFESWIYLTQGGFHGRAHDSQWIGSHRIEIELHLTGKSRLIFQFYRNQFTNENPGSF